MVWYSGGIVEAIAESRAKSRLFIVYVTGQDEPSQKMDKLWENEKVQNLCKSDCVALKLDSQSEGCKQFSAIYPVLCVPSAYFINNKGEILDALAIMSDETEFVQKFENAIQKFRDATKSTSSAASTSSSPAQQSTESSAGADAAPEVAATASPGPSDVPVQAKKSEEEIKNDVNRLQAKIQEKRKQDAENKKEEERRRETERRELGKNIQKLKEAQQETKMKREIEERRKSKIEEKEARERVKRQIEQDKLDRAARFEQEKQEREEAKVRQRFHTEEEIEEKKAQEAKERSMHARLQFRMPDGSTFTHHFSATDTLQSAYDIVSQNSPYGAAKFSLSVAFPRRVFTDSERSATLGELSLAPSASLIVLPHQDTGSAPPVASTSIFTQILSVALFILMIPMRLLQYIWSFISGPAPPVSAQTESQATPNSSGQSSGTRPRGPDASKDTDRQGNMTRLKDLKRGDDDEATWNGNSTQQL